MEEKLTKWSYFLLKVRTKTKKYRLLGCRKLIMLLPIATIDMICFLDASKWRMLPILYKKTIDMGKCLSCLKRELKILLLGGQWPYFTRKLVSIISTGSYIKHNKDVSFSQFFSIKYSLMPLNSS